MEILQYEFFRQALYITIILSIIGSILWSLIVTRREVQIGHSISNFALLWIIAWFATWIESNLTSLALAIFWAFVIFFMERYKSLTRDSVLEISSQIALSLSIFLLWIYSNIKVEIESILFWNILTIWNNDFNLFLGVSSVILILLIIFYKDILAISLNKSLAKAFWKNYNALNLLFLILSAVFITFAIKLIWVLLISAFLIIPSNIWKALWHNNKSMLIIWIIASLTASAIWLFGSYFANTATSASIVLSMWWLLILSLIIWKIRKKS